MELTVLGKYGPYGKKEVGAASGYLVRNENDLLAMDMGSGTLSRLMGQTDIRALSGIFISHLHYDHTSDLLPFRYLLEDLNHRMTVFTHFEDSDWYRLLFDHPLLSVVNIDEHTEAMLGSMRLRFFEMKHTVTDYAVRVTGEKTLCYTGDTVMNKNIPALIEGADLVLADCSKPKGFTGPHMTVEDAKKLTKQYRVPFLATHLSPGYDPSAEFSGCDLITVAEEGKTYTI